MMDHHDNTLNILLQQYLETEKDLTEKQKRVLQAAVEVFSEKGFAAATTSEIAHRAQVAEGTIFKHYKTKKGLLFSILSPVIVRLGAPLLFKDFEAVITADYPHLDDLLRAVINNRLDYAQKNIAVIKILINEVSFQPELRALGQEVFTERIRPRLQVAFNYFRDNGEMKDLPDETVIRLLISTVMGYIVTRYVLLPDKRWDDEDEVDKMVEFLVQGLKP